MVASDIAGKLQHSAVFKSFTNEHRYALRPFVFLDQLVLEQDLQRPRPMYIYRNLEEVIFDKFKNLFKLLS